MTWSEDMLSLAVDVSELSKDAGNAMNNESRVQALLADLRQSTVSTGAARIAAEYISNLYDELVVGARCICCDDVEVCDEECTFSEDCPEEAERMAYIRDTLRVPGR